MKCMSASEMKGSRTRKVVRSMPAEETEIRKVYDLFQANKGKVITYATNKRNAQIIETLMDYYGLDIRNVGYRKWLLAGEWFGKVYIDYVAENMEARSEK